MSLSPLPWSLKPLCNASLLLLLLLGACATTNSAPPAIGKAQNQTIAPSATAPTPLPAPTPSAPTTKSAFPIDSGAMKVGLLLPLSGQHAALGQALLNAAQLAVFDDKNAKIELMPRDTGSEPAKAIAAFNALADAGASVMVGPLFARQVAAIKPIVAQRGISVLALSNDQNVAGGGVYVLGISPAAQIARITNYACSQNAKLFVTMLPTGVYGNAIHSALQKAVHNCSGATLAMQRYDVGGNLLAQQLQAAAPVREQFDALLLAADPASLATFAYPPELNGQNVMLLGTGLWDDTNAVQRAPFLNGALFAAPANAEQNGFATKYQAAYGATPPKLASLSYDAVALATVIQKSRRKIDAATLTNAGGFRGVDGIFRLNRNGTAERGLAVYQLTPNGAVQRDAAPASFSKGNGF